MLVFIYLKGMNMGDSCITVKRKPFSPYFTEEFPIWWGEAPHIVYSLVENVNLKKKTVIPFSTSISSGLGSSGKHLRARANISSKTKWMKGRNFYDIPSQKTVNKWVSKIEY